MNINPNVKRILCFGDSNTWGFNPKSKTRYPANTRWTGSLQKLLGEKYEIIEEGLNGRTTNLDTPDHVGKNGAIYLLPCVETHMPFDTIILALGTNDLKAVYKRSTKEIAEAVEELVLLIKKESPDTEIILVSPTEVDESVMEKNHKYAGAEEKSKLLGKYYEKVAKKQELAFLDLAKIAKPSRYDGRHLDAKTHEIIAEKLAQLISRT
jgi:lysophospholipase L1-like esterase